MGTRLTLTTINSEMMKRGNNARLEKASGYFYFKGGDATAWIDRTVAVPAVNSLTLDQWMEEFVRLKNLNAESESTAERGKRAPGRKPRGRAEPHRQTPAAVT